MATEDILIRYRADVSQLEADINKVIASQEELTAATKANTTEEFHGAAQFVQHGFSGPAVWLAAAGVALAWLLYLKRPGWPARLHERAGGLYTLFENKYYFDWFNENVIAAGSRMLGTALWKGGDVALIDGAAVNGSARLVAWVAQAARGLQSGYLYHYAFATIIGLSVLLAWLLWRS